MSARPSRPRPRRRVPRLLGFAAEGLEARRLLVATPINVAAGLTLAIASPLPGLASTAGPISQSQAIATTSATVAPVSVTSSGPATNLAMATGPATTLSPLANDSETANATASEVARPRPGQTDRVQSAVPEAETTPAPRVEAPTPVEVIPGPELQAPTAPPAVEPAPAEPVAPTPPNAAPAPAPAPVPELAPLPDAPDLGFAAWDVALDLVSADQPEETEAPPTVGSVAVAAGVVVVAWGGWQLSPQSKGRSQQNPVVVAGRVAGPGKLPVA